MLEWAMFDEVFADLRDAGVEVVASRTVQDERGRKGTVKYTAAPVGDMGDEQAWLDAAAAGVSITGKVLLSRGKGQLRAKDVSGERATSACAKLFGFAPVAKPNKRGGKPDTIANGEPVKG